MLPAFQYGVAGRLGNGHQRMSWIALDDAIDIMTRALGDDRYQGAINTVAPDPVSNREFTKVLANLLNRPAILPLPAIAIKALFGEMGQTALLGDLALKPARLQELDYPFRHPTIGDALAFSLGR